MSDTFQEVKVDDQDEGIGWRRERFHYTLDQMKWIAAALALNGGRISVVLEQMADRSCGFPIKPRPMGFLNAANWCRMIEKVKSCCCDGKTEFTEEWDYLITRAYQEKL